MNIVALVCILAGTAVVDSSVLPGARHDTLGHTHAAEDISGHVHITEDTSSHAHGTGVTLGNVPGTGDTIGQAHAAKDVSGHVEHGEEASNLQPSTTGIAEDSKARDAILKDETRDVNAEEDIQKGGLILNIEEESGNNAPKIENLGDLSSVRTDERVGVADSQNEIKVEGFQAEGIDGDESELPENLAIISTTNSKKNNQPQSQVSFQGSFEDEPKESPETSQAVTEVEIKPEDFRDAPSSNQSSGIITNADEQLEQVERTSITSGDDFTLQDSVRDSASDSSPPSVSSSSPLVEKSVDGKVIVRRLRRPLVKSRGTSRAVFASSPMAAKNMMIMPYRFGFSVEDPTGGVYHKRTEEQPNEGPLVGSYAYLRADGVYMTVKYTAGVDGYKATVHESAPPAGTRRVLPGTILGAATRPSGNVAGTAGGGAHGVAPETAGNGTKIAGGGEGEDGIRTAGASGSPGVQQRPSSGVRSQSQIIRDAYRKDIIQREKQQQDQQQLQLQQLLHQQKQQQFQQLQHQYRQQQHQLHNQFRQHQQQQHQFPQGLPADEFYQNLQGIAPVSGANPHTIGQLPSTFSGVVTADGTNSQPIGQFSQSFSGATSPEGTISQSISQFPQISSGVTSPEGANSQPIGQFPQSFSGVVSSDDTNSQNFDQFPLNSQEAVSPDRTNSQTISQFPQSFSGVVSSDGTNSQPIGQFPQSLSGVTSPEGTNSQLIGQFPHSFSGVPSSDDTNSQNFGQFALISQGAASPDSTSSQTISQFPPSFFGVVSPDGTSSQAIGQFPAGFSGVVSADGTSSQSIGQFPAGFSGVVSPDGTSSQAIGQFPAGFSGVVSADGTSSQAIGQFPTGFSGIMSPDGISSQAIGQFPAGFSGVVSADGTNSQAIGQFPAGFSGVVSADGTSSQAIGHFPAGFSGVVSPDGTSSQAIGQFPADFSGVFSADGTSSQAIGQFPAGFSGVVSADGTSSQAIGQSPLSFSGLTSTIINTHPETISNSVPTLQGEVPTNQFKEGINNDEDKQRLPGFLPETAANPGFVGQSPVFVIGQQATGVQPPLVLDAVQGLPRPTYDSNPLLITLKPGNNQFTTDEFSPTISIIQSNNQISHTTDHLENNQNENVKSEFPAEAERLNDQNYVSDNSDTSTRITSTGQSGAPYGAQSPILVQGTASDSLPDQNHVQFRPIPVRTVDRNRFPFPESIFPGNQFAPGSGIQHVDRPHHTVENVNGQSLHPNYISFNAIKGQEDITQVIVPGVQSNPNTQINPSITDPSIPVVSGSDNFDQTNPEAAPVQQQFDQQLEKQNLPAEQLFGLTAPVQQTPEHRPVSQQSFGHQLPIQQTHVEALPGQESFTSHPPQLQPLDQHQFPGQPPITSQQSPDQQAFHDQSANEQSPKQQLFGLESFSPEKQQFIDEQFGNGPSSVQESYGQDINLQPLHTPQSTGLQSSNERLPGQQNFQQSSSLLSTGQQSSEFFTGSDIHEQSTGQILPNKEIDQQLLVQKPISDNIDGISDQQPISPSFESPKQSDSALISPISEVNLVPKPHGNTPPSSIGDETAFGVSGDSTSTDEYEVGVIERVRESSVQTPSITGHPIRPEALNPQVSPNGQAILQSPILSVNGVQQNNVEGIPISVEVPENPLVTDPIAQDDLSYQSDVEQEKVDQGYQQTNLNSADVLQIDATQQNNQQRVNIIPGVVATYGNQEDASIRNPSVISPQDNSSPGAIDSANTAGVLLSGKPHLQTENVIVTWPSTNEQSVSQSEDSQATENGNVIFSTINRPNQQYPSVYPNDPYQGISDISYFQNNVPAPIFPGTFSSVVRGVQPNQVAPTHPLQTTTPLHYVAQDSKVPINQTGEQFDPIIGQYNISQGPTRPFLIPQHLPQGGITNYLSTQHAVTQHTQNTHQFTFYPFAGGIFPVTNPEAEQSTRMNDKGVEETQPCSCEKNGSEDLKDQANLAPPEHRFTFLQNAAAKLPFPDQIYFRNILNQIISQSDNIRQFEEKYRDTAPIVWRVPTRISLDGQPSLPLSLDGSHSQTNGEAIKPVFYTIPENELEVPKSAGNELKANSASGDSQEVQIIAASSQRKDQQKVIEINPSQIPGENVKIYSNFQTDVAASGVPADSEKPATDVINTLNPLVEEDSKYFEDQDKIISGQETNLTPTDVGILLTPNQPTFESDPTTIEIEHNQSDLPVAPLLEIPHLDSTPDNSLGKNPLDPTSSPFGVLVSQSESDSLFSSPIDDSSNTETAEETQRSQLTHSTTTKGANLFGGNEPEHNSNESPNPVSFNLPAVPEKPRGYDYSPPAKQFDFAAQFRG